MTVGLVCGLAALLVVAGLGAGRLHGWRPAGSDEALLVGFVAGALALHLTMMVADLAGVTWSRPILVVPLVALALPMMTTVASSLRRGRSSLRRWWASPSAADALVVVVVAVIAWLSFRGWVGAPDFVYHWGPKGERSFLAGGIDLGFLQAPWNEASVRPDYPNLLPNLFAATATLRGMFRSTAGLMWGPICAGLLLVGCRRALLDVTDRGAREAGLAFVALYLLATWIVLRRSGDGDALVALALVAAVPYLLRPSRGEDDLAVGLLAAFAAAGKLEGLAVAAFLIAAHALRRRRAAVTLVLPTLLVVVPWAWKIIAHDLGSSAHSGAFQPDRLGQVPRLMLEVALRPGWSGFGVAILVLIPLLALPRSTRWVGLLLLAQLAFYAVIYLVTPLDVETLVRTSFSRLLWQLSPAALVSGFVLLATPSSSSLPQARPVADGTALSAAG